MIFEQLDTAPQMFSNALCLVSAMPLPGHPLLPTPWCKAAPSRIYLQHHPTATTHLQLLARRSGPSCRLSNWTLPTAGPSGGLIWSSA